MTTRRQALQSLGAGAFALTAGGILAPEARGLIFTGGSAATSPGQPFDYYVSTTGSDTNAGTLASPWAITAINTKQATYAGKSVGLLPGTYDVSGLMGTNESVAALTLIGGSSLSAQTYVGSSDSSGHYSRGTATLDGMGSTGFYGGSNANASAILAARSGANYWTVDGLRFTGYSMWAFHVGNSPGGGSAPTNWTIQNCEFTGGNASFATQAAPANGVNCGLLIVYCGQNGTVYNNWFHDSIGNSRDTQHWSCVYQWSLGGTTNDKTFNIRYLQNTIVNAGNLHGKEGGPPNDQNQFNHEIAYNYIDMTGTLASSEFCGSAIEGWMCTGADAAATLTQWHHNIIRANSMALSFDNDNASHSFVNYPLHVYNNTVVLVGSQVDGFVYGGYTDTGVANQVSYYNNLIYNEAGIGVSQYGYWLTNVNTFALLDYNIYGTWAAGAFHTVPAGNNTSSPGIVAYSTLATWAAALTGVSGAEAHSTTSSANPFVGGSVPSPAKYQLAAGALPNNFGRAGGVSTGAPVNAGAWDGTVTQIGCSFAVYS